MSNKIINKTDIIIGSASIFIYFFGWAVRFFWAGFKWEMLIGGGLISTGLLGGAWFIVRILKKTDGKNGNGANNVHHG